MTDPNPQEVEQGFNVTAARRENQRRLATVFFTIISAIVLAFLILLLFPHIAGLGVDASKKLP